MAKNTSRVPIPREQTFTLRDIFGAGLEKVTTELLTELETAEVCAKTLAKQQKAVLELEAHCLKKYGFALREALAASDAFDTTVQTCGFAFGHTLAAAILARWVAGQGDDDVCA